ncbi:MAG: methyltransferase [Acidobacteriota bacterium]
MKTREWNAGTLMELSGSYWETCALHAAVKLDVFTAIGKNSLTAGDLAQKIRADKRALGMLLNALSAMKLLAKAGKTYTAGKEALEFLSRDSDRYIGFMIQHHRDLMPAWARLDEAVAKGAPLRERASFEDAERREHFLMGMFNIAINLAPKIVPDIDLSGRKRLLDFGGGPGTYAIQFCLHNPGLKASIYDLPTSRPFAEKTVARFGVSDRVDFIGGNYLEDSVPDGFDAAWLSQILHSENPDGCRKIIRKAAGAVESGGTVMIHEFILDDAMDGPLHPALFSLNMLLGTDAGQAYSGEQIAGMMESEGIRDIRRLELPGAHNSGVIQGTVS